MNDEQSKRLSEAADALLQAHDALNEARDAIADRRFDSDAERERLAATQQMANRLEAAGKKIDDAIRRGTIAAAVLERAGAYERYRAGAAACSEGRTLARTATDQDGAANKRSRGQEGLARLEDAIGVAAALVFEA